MLASLYMHRNYAVGCYVDKLGTPTLKALHFVSSYFRLQCVIQAKRTRLAKNHDLQLTHTLRLPLLPETTQRTPHALTESVKAVV